MADPVSEDAEYVVFVRRGHPKLFLSQRGQLEDPGPVRVICDRQVGERRPKREGFPRGCRTA